MSVEGIIVVKADDRAGIVDACCNGAAGSQGIVKRRVSAAIINEAVSASIVLVGTDNLPGVVDAVGIGEARSVDRSVSPTAVYEAMSAGVVLVESDDLARIVDAGCIGGADAGRIVQGGIGAAAIEKPVF